MGERDVEEIIEQWRASARDAGESVPLDRPGRERLRRRWWRRGVVAGAVAGIVAAAALVLVSTGSDAHQEPAAAADPGGPAPTAGPPGLSESGLGDGSPSVEEWFAIVEAVDRARGQAYRAGDASPLAEMFADDGPALERERQVLSALRAEDAEVHGWRTEVLAVSVVDYGTDRAVLRVRDRRGAYLLVPAEGASIPVGPAEPRSWLVTLERELGRWLVIESVPDVTSQPPQP